MSEEYPSPNTLWAVAAPASTQPSQSSTSLHTYNCFVV